MPLEADAEDVPEDAAAEVVRTVPEPPGRTEVEAKRHALTHLPLQLWC